MFIDIINHIPGVELIPDRCGLMFLDSYALGRRTGIDIFWNCHYRLRNSSTAKHLAILLFSEDLSKPWERLRPCNVEETHGQIYNCEEELDCAPRLLNPLDLFLSISARFLYYRSEKFRNELERIQRRRAIEGIRNPLISIGLAGDS